MKNISINNYHCNAIIDKNSLIIFDHLGGFDQKYFSPILEKIVQIAKQENITSIVTAYNFNNLVKCYYPEIKFLHNQSLIGGDGWENMVSYNIHPELTFKNFVCSFNGSPHVGRKLLVSYLHKFGWDNKKYCSKNFSFSTDVIDGHIRDYVEDHIVLYRKFFISADSEDFFQSINSFGHVRFNHDQNIYNLETKLTESFLHIVSETMATSYYPFVTEKFLYSVVTRGLFLAYAQPGWHAHLEKYYGFKRYTKLFDYRFDSIENPVERLVELMSMISKFSVLSSDEWRDLYLLEQDTIEYNYDHYFSQRYMKCLEKYE